jgi:hypothetical protein
MEASQTSKPKKDPGKEKKAPIPVADALEQIKKRQLVLQMYQEKVKQVLLMESYARRTYLESPNA